MGFLFDDASLQYLENTAVLIQPPFTALAWYKPDAAVVGTVFAMTDGAASNYYQVGWTGTTTRVRSAAAGASSTGSSAGSDATLDVWKLVGGCYVGDSYRKGWLNNLGSGVNTATRAPTGLDRTSVGRIVAQPTWYASGVIDVVGVWRCELSDAEVNFLYASQYDFRAVRPDDLVELWYLRGNQTVVGEIRGFPLYNFGTVQSTNAPIVPYQPRRRVQFKAAAGGDVTVNASALGATASLQAPSLAYALTAPVLTATASLPTPALTATVSPAVLSAVASVQAPALSATLAVSTLTATASQPAPTLEARVSPAVLSAIGSLPAPALESRISPAALSALTSTQAPTLVIDGADVTVNAPVLTALASLQAPTVVVPVDITVSAPVLSALASLPAPTVIVPVDVTVNAPVLSANVTLAAPVVTTGPEVVVVPPGSGGSAGGDGGFAYAAGAAQTPGTASERKPYLETIKELSHEAEAEAEPEAPKARRSRSQRRREKLARKKARVKPQIQATGKPVEPLPSAFTPYPIPPASPADIQARAEAEAAQEALAREVLQRVVDAETQRQAAFAEIERALVDQQMQNQARQEAIAARLQAIAEDDAEFQLITQLLMH